MFWRLAIKKCLKKDLKDYDRSILQKQLMAKKDGIRRITKDILFEYEAIPSLYYVFNDLQAEIIRKRRNNKAI